MTDQVTTGDTMLIQRNLMVDAQVRPNNVNDRRVIEAMRTLPREAFAPASSLAYADADIPLGNGRYMLAPMTIARLTQLVLAENPATILVIGAGSGYGAAILAAAGAQVVALEEDPALDTGALAKFAPAVEGVRGALAKAWPAAGPYDAILIEGAVLEIPAILAAQLVPDGRIVAILAEPGPARIGRAVVAAPSGGGFAVLKKFDCAARLLPAFRPAPAFSF
jgi:protein-L-isoaspartate(D-aspartate) O-methyltransferase